MDDKRIESPYATGEKTKAQQESDLRTAGFSRRAATFADDIDAWEVPPAIRGRYPSFPPACSRAEAVELVRRVRADELAR